MRGQCQLAQDTPASHDVMAALCLHVVVLRIVQPIRTRCGWAGRGCHHGGWQYWGACSREKHCGELAIRMPDGPRWVQAAEVVEMGSATKQKLDPYVLAITIFAIASVAVAGTAVAIYLEV